ncbi:MAG TPA: hypothetical protein V6C65_37210 [Allocoleopsis sp.]
MGQGSGVGNGSEQGNGSRSNFRWQLSMLKALEAIRAAIAAGGGGSLTPHSGFSPTVTTSTAGSVAAASAYSVIFHNTGGAAAIINDAPLAANSSRTYTAAVGKTLPAISYDASGTTLVIEQLNY